jgi:uncharacterized lipoprotein YddW (UPF0748 family)
MVLRLQALCFYRELQGEQFVDMLALFSRNLLFHIFCSSMNLSVRYTFRRTWSCAVSCAIIFAVLVLLSLSELRAQSFTPKLAAVRGVWLTNVDSDAMTSREKLRVTVELCKELGINTIFVVTWNRAMTLYPSRVMEQLTGIKIDPRFNGRDPLKELIEEAKPRGIKVFAWFEFGFSCSYDDPDGGIIIRRKPHWASRGVDGKIVSKNKFQWMNAFLPEVQDFVLSLLKEVVQNYDVDGIQGDDRLPAVPSETGYDSSTVARYKAEHGGNEPPRYHKDFEWITWRAEILNDYMKRIARELRALKPALVISMSPSIYPWSKEEYLQDWPTWLREGWVDLVCPQVYRYNIDSYKRELAIMLTRQVRPEDRFRVAPGVLLKVSPYLASEELLRQMTQANREAGLNGEVFFFYEGVKPRVEFFKALYRERADFPELLRR